ncbi:hypothetical protein [Actinoallomurus rhizosphaericola]|uniref:hypothetical protein n=1 Tax=Actinoallomurus rhizosphaericola TaxID=2952536 RepID=UPI0020918414|nr:hypothetical protein [Actinoallomurus rhizosphaericola]MCO5992612.1 hypothetical protein [Actinoallomurus rhizosphaericola]
MSPFVLSVPEVVTSHYVIATSEPPVDPYAVVPWRVPEPFRKPAIEALKTPRLGIFTVDAGEATWRLDDVLACDEDRRRVRESSHQILLVHQALTVEQPHREQVARAVARALADATNGVLIDPQARQVLLRDGLARAERGWFRMGDQWFGTRYEVDEAARRPGPAGAAGCACLRVTLLGLRRFGLPNLVIDGVACTQDLPALNLLRAIASRLLTDQWRWCREHPARPTRSLDDHPRIEPDDFWAFWGATPFLDGGPVVTRLAATSTGTLEVTPPDGYAGTVADWSREVLAPALPPLVGCPADEDTAHARSAGGGA